MVAKIIAIMFIFHGLAHISGFLAAWTSVDAGYKINQPLLFTKNILLKGILGKIFGIVWLIAMALFLHSAILLFKNSFEPLYILYAAIFSLLAMIPWWKTIPPGAKAGALLDLIIMILILTGSMEKLL